MSNLFTERVLNMTAVTPQPEDYTGAVPYTHLSYTPQRMQETIIKLLEQWQRKRQRDQER